MIIRTCNQSRTIVATIAFTLILTACSTPPTKPDGAATARSKLTSLQSDSQLASLAPVEIKEAEMAVRAAEVPQKDAGLAKHLVFMADSKVEIAKARAQSRLYEDQRAGLGEQSEKARLDSRTREADQARQDADSSRIEADVARSEAEMARMSAEEARQTNADLQQQINELNARETDRGLVMTLGDVLFETGKSDLKGGTTNNLGKLAMFLNKYPDRTVVIEGHTDNVGGEDSNFSLSQRRADSVKSFLVNQGINSSRLTTSGMGEGTPVSGNDTATGRQQNRRVEVIISNVNLSSR